MRYLVIILSVLISSGAYAIDYPEPSDPVAKKFVERFKQDKVLLDSPAFFEVSNTSPAWPCEIPEEEIRRIAGVGGMSSLPADVQKKMKESYRKVGMKPPKDVEYKNLQIIPIKAQCAKGKLVGDIDLIVSHDTDDESTSSQVLMGKVVHKTTVTKRRTLRRIQGSIRDGKFEDMASFSQSTTQTDSHWDDELMESKSKETNEIFNKPTPVQTVSYFNKNGEGGSFLLLMQKEVRAGALGLGTSVKEVPQLLSTFSIPIDAHYSRTEEYTNKSLTHIRNLKDRKMHGESIFNWGNYAKENNMPPGSQEEQIKITCYQDGEEVRMSPCPSE